ncbi:hypothetical protein CVIRNUC_011038 [Coccomyxa viridis]|uniref:Uncharacterized protein n=1 Tax=Coccomyxa viridis TaxID=1274662 RepID=A0AAV1IKF7_9CHLO|nr:hypothetical protein CVIRNUC_011038 [Coccomyxa viridis]
MTALQRNARSFLLLRLIRNVRDVETSHSRLLWQLAPSNAGHEALNGHQARTCTALSSGSANPPHIQRQSQHSILPPSSTLSVLRGNSRPPIAFSQAAGFAASSASHASSSKPSRESTPTKTKTAGQAFHDAGWTRREVFNIANALSMGRLLSGPLVAHLIMQHHWPAALTTLAIAGASDWADGYAAKHWGTSSVLGSYLDPLADKVLVGCTVGALAAEGSLPVALAAIIIGRDILLVTGACVDRCRRIGWRRVGWAEFFRTAPSEALRAEASLDTNGVQQAACSVSKSQVAPGSPDHQHEVSVVEASQEAGDGEQQPQVSSRAPGSKSKEQYTVPPAELVQPLYISKVNTCLQLGLIAGCISHSWYGWPAEQALWGLGGITGLATLASFVAYVQVYRRGNVRTKII